MMYREKLMPVACASPRQNWRDAGVSRVPIDGEKRRVWGASLTGKSDFLLSSDACHARSRGFESGRNRISSRCCLRVSDPICVLVSRVITAANTQPPHLVLKSCSLKSEALSRPAFPGYPSGRVAQSVDNHAPLSFPER